MSALTALALLITSARAAAPVPVDYTLDPTRSSLKFTFKQDGAENQGRFRKYDVVLRFAENNLPASRLDVTVQLDSLDTGDEQRDGEMKGVNGFDVAKYPVAKFHATKISLTSVGRYEAIGKLTLHGVSRDIRVPLSFRAATERSGPAAYITGRAGFNRLDFGVGQGQYKATDFIANEVGVNFGLRFTAKAPAAGAAATQPAKPAPAPAKPAAAAQKPKP
jgi:polyisoprenoid-binding protein YceI